MLPGQRLPSHGEVWFGPNAKLRRVSPARGNHCESDGAYTGGQENGRPARKRLAGWTERTRPERWITVRSRIRTGVRATHPPRTKDSRRYKIPLGIRFFGAIIYPPQ